MAASLVNILSALVVAVLLVFAARRLLFMTTLLRPQPPLPTADALPTVLLLVAGRDEAAALQQLLPALDRLDYPRDRLRVVLIDDGSTDATGALFDAAAAKLPNWHALHIPANVGKAEALNRALAGHDFGEVVYVFDADHQPWSDCLRIAVAAFADPCVAGVNGRMLVGNWSSSPAAFYAKVESLVHQLVTVRGKDVLGLGPPLLGANTGYRRSALDAVGGFRSGAFLEDTDLTLRLHRAGWRTRFVPQAISVHGAPATIAGYARQHLRWGRGFNDAARENFVAMLRDARLPLPMRVELALFSLGYLDRLAVLGALGLLLLRLLLSARVDPLLTTGIALSILLPLGQVVAVLAFDRATRAMWARLPLVPFFFAVDALVAVWVAVLTLLDRPRVWQPTERAH
ncbi:MAG: glycosyltransferase [Anaerolineales bacterium]